MKLKDFLKECEALDISVDKKIGAKLNDERLAELGISLDLNVAPKMRKAVVARKVKSLRDVISIYSAIKLLRKGGLRVDFASVAEKAGVSDPTVRKYAEVEVCRLRELDAKVGSKTASNLKKRRDTPASDESKDTIILAVRKRNRELVQTNTDLNERNETLLSKVIELTAQVEKLQRLTVGSSEDG